MPDIVLPDVTFAEGDARALSAALKSVYEAVRRASGEPAYSMAESDPMRLVQLSEAALLAQVNSDIDATGKGNLLYYAGEETIEHLGNLYGERGARLMQSAATTTIRYTLSALRGASVTVPAGCRTTPDNKVFFATTEPLEIPAGKWYGDVGAKCTTVGEDGNGFEEGEIRNIVDRMPFIQSAVNITKSEGGADTEPLEEYRARIHLLPESFSVAGPDGAYEFWAMSANADIIDVAVWSPEPGHVNIVPLMRGGIIPEDEILESVYEKCNAKTRRPLTDFVHVLPPKKREYEISVKWWAWDSDYSIERQAAVYDAADRYIEWQCGELGRDINPSMLLRFIMGAGAKRAEILSPVFTVLEQDEISVLIAEKNIVYEGAEDA